ncbi:MAG TPA: extracellular solute-binding protein [Terriglobales bacterium]|nr:extracellular solute-binding protein [Terriglobales bacterium]
MSAFCLRVLSRAVPIISIGVFPVLVLAQGVNVDAAKKEGKAVVYGTIVPQVMSQIEKGFEAKYGIKTEYWRADATKVIDRVLTEWRSGKPGFDVVIGARGPLNLGKLDNVYAKFAPPSAANFPAKFKDKDGQLVAWRITPVGILYNTELVKPNDVPKSLDDLLDAKWLGKVSMPDPSRHASTAQYLWNLQQVKGEKWLDFAKGLAKQKPVLVESYSTVPNTIVRGEALVGITYIQYAGQTKGPISFAPINQVFADPSDAALSAKAANSNAARLFIEYLCSPEGQKRVAETGEFVLSPGIFPAIKDGDKIMTSLYMMNDPSADTLAKLQNDFRQMFLAK